MRRKTVRAGWVLATLGVLATLTLTACTRASNSGSAEAGDAVRGAGGAGVAAPAGAAGDPVAKPGGSATGGAQAAKAPVDDGTAKIRVAEMTVSVKRGGVAAAADRATSIALGVGGEVDSDDRSAGAYATASLQLRVPPEALTPVLKQLSRLGHEVSRQLSTTDVTEMVADVDSRVRSAQDSIARLRTLYASARKVADVIAIESELNSREADLESLQAQQRALQRQTAMATITLSLRTVAPAAVKPVRPDHRGGFLGGLQRGWDGFVSAAVWVATAVGTVLPFLVLLAVLALAGRVVWGRRPRRPASDPPL